MSERSTKICISFNNTPLYSSNLTLVTLTGTPTNPSFSPITTYHDGRFFSFGTMLFDRKLSLVYIIHWIISDRNSVHTSKTVCYDLFCAREKMQNKVVRAHLPFFGLQFFLISLQRCHTSKELFVTRKLSFYRIATVLHWFFPTERAFTKICCSSLIRKRF